MLSSNHSKIRYILALLCNKNGLPSMKVEKFNRSGLYANSFGPKSKPKISDSGVALFAECVFYFESLLVSALIKIHTLVEIPSRSERRE